MKPGPSFELSLRVYPEDVDCTGFAHHTSYVRFFARARTEAFAAMGTSATAWAERGLGFPIYALDLEVPCPAHAFDNLRVTSHPRRLSAFRIEFVQHIERADGSVVARARVELVCTDLSGRLQPLPAPALLPL